VQSVQSLNKGKASDRMLLSSPRPARGADLIFLFMTRRSVVLDKALAFARTVALGIWDVLSMR
jgi:hypothetical protein